jgi:hypothetical protein
MQVKVTAAQTQFVKTKKEKNNATVEILTSREIHHIFPRIIPRQQSM